jgi:putative transposase
MKFRIIEDQRETFPVRVLCDVMGVSTAGYYAWRGRPESPRKAANRALLAEIRRLHLAHRGRYGGPRIHAALCGLGHTASRGRVERLMRHHGIRAITPRRFRACTTDSRHDWPIAPNRLAQKFVTERPNQVWLADITYVPTEEGWLYLAVVLNLFRCRRPSQPRWSRRMPLPREVANPVRSSNPLPLQAYRPLNPPTPEPRADLYL